MPINYEPSTLWNSPLKTKNEELTRELDQVIRLALSKKHTSVSYAVMIDGQLAASNALGTTGGKDPQPASVDCTYNVASISKIYTTTAVMQLVEKGLLDLDEPVINYIPEFRTLGSGFEKITLRHCLSHSCALPGTQWINFSVSDQSEVDYYRDALEFFAHSHLKAEPGEYSVYCNDGFTLAEMAVAAVCEEKSFSEYCRLHITDPLGAWSSRFARSYNPEYPMIAQGKGPAELVTCQGMGGLTTTMEHLTIFGNQFLPGVEEGAILNSASIREMLKPQGRSFLKKDEAAVSYGLGWDNVHYSHPDYDLGPDAFRKGGASFQFASQLLVVPKYRAVVALSQTYDCDLDGRSTALQLLALSLLKTRGINITRFKPVPDSFEKRYAGDYLNTDNALRVSVHGPFLYLQTENARGVRKLFETPFGYTGRHFVNASGRILTFETALAAPKESLRFSGTGRYMLSALRGPMSPMAEKAKDGPALSATWKKRLGKKYINVSVSPYDEIIPDMMSGLKLVPCLDFKGILWASQSCSGSGDDPDSMDTPLKPLSKDIATGCIRIPDDAGRDLISTLFFKEKGVEYCHAGSYLFRDTASLPVLEAAQLPETDLNDLPRDPHPIHGLHSEVPGAACFSFTGKLTKLPQIPEGHRLLLLSEDLHAVYDSLMQTEDFTSLENGFGIFA